MDKPPYYNIRKAAAKAVYKNWAFASEIQDSVTKWTSRHQVESLIEKIAAKKLMINDRIDIHWSKDQLDPIEKEKLRRLDKEAKICDYLINRQIKRLLRIQAIEQNGSNAYRLERILNIEELKESGIYKQQQISLSL